MLVETFPVGSLGCNCTVLACDATREAIVIDPGDDTPRILDVVKANDLRVVSIVHTHAHIDHVMATGGVKRETGGEIGLHADDRWLYEHVSMQGMMLGMRATDPPPADRWLAHGDVLTWGETGRLEVVHTPGHSPGSVCFTVDGLETVFSGDTLFAGGIGRTDLWGGSFETILASLHNRVLALPDDLRVVPGHGPLTTIGDERRSNPFLQGPPPPSFT